ncbi:MAG: redoxin domain-containing protein [Bacteroidales bacterium]|nr:redoxin domain-containing protein [Bacteroidales bacterium]
MIRKITAALLILLLTTVLLYFTFSTIKKVQAAKSIHEHIEHFPGFSLKSINDIQFNSDTITKGPVVIIFFHPGCEHCQYEIKEITTAEYLIDKTHIILVSSAPEDEIKKFYYDNELDRYQKITLLIDSNYKLSDIFGLQSVPSTYIYNKELILVKYFEGEVKPEAILKYLTDND